MFVFRLRQKCFMIEIFKNGKKNQRFCQTFEGKEMLLTNCWYMLFLQHVLIDHLDHP